MAASIGVQRRLKGKPLSSPPLRVAAHECEITGARVTQQATSLSNEIFKMPLPFLPYLRICSAGESVDLVDHPLEQVFDNRRGPLQERCCDRGHHALCP